jgi:hypothetical protein
MSIKGEIIKEQKIEESKRSEDFTFVEKEGYMIKE